MQSNRNIPVQGVSIHQSCATQHHSPVLGLEPAQLPLTLADTGNRQQLEAEQLQEAGLHCWLQQLFPEQAGDRQSHISHWPKLLFLLSRQATDNACSEGQGMPREFCSLAQMGWQNSPFCSTIRAGGSEHQLAEREAATPGAGAAGGMGTPPLQSQTGLLGSAESGSFLH